MGLFAVAQTQSTTGVRNDSACGPAGCIVSNDSNTSSQSEQSDKAGDNPDKSSNITPNRDFTQRSTRQNSSERDDSDSRVTGASRRSQPRSGLPLSDTADSTNARERIPEPKSDFEKFAQDTTGHVLPTFGKDLFLNRAENFVLETSISPPVDYVVGPGDQVKIHAWGNVDIDVQARIDRDGQLFLPHVGTVSAAGLKLDQLEGVVRSAIGKQFKNFELSLTLGQLRSIQIFVLGEARRPGVYTVSSLSTLVNALFESGGPSDAGSLRDIQLKRGGNVLTHFDVYDLLLRGDKGKDVHLLAGDVIFIPLVGPQIAVDGDVTKPAIYELRGATTVDDALKIAGGLTPVAGTDRASLDRIANHQQRTVQDFPLTGAQSLIQVQGGDLLRVFPISSKIERAVTLRGNIGTPGRYPWRPGMHVSDLIPNRQFLLARRYFNAKNSLNPPPAEHPFGSQEKEKSGRAGERLSALSEDEAAASASAPELLTTAPQSELGNHETEINWNYAVVERLGSIDLKTEILPFALGEAIDHPASSENRALEPGDTIIVYSREDINLPSELRARFVRIDGEVNKPGVYQLSSDETLRDLISRAGGISPHGYLYASQLLRESVRIAEDRKLAELIRKESRDVLSPSNQQVSTADGRSVMTDLDLRRAYIQALSQIHSTGRVTLQIAPTATGLEAVPEFTLQDGDHFFVPTRPNTVDVLGNVFNQGSLRYVSGAKVDSYLKAAGNRTREGDRSQEFVLRADGTVLSREVASRFEKLVIYPGDTVIVPARLKAGFNVYQLLGFGQIVSSFAIAALAIRSID